MMNVLVNDETYDTVVHVKWDESNEMYQVMFDDGTWIYVQSYELVEVWV